MHGCMWDYLWSGKYCFFLKKYIHDTVLYGVPTYTETSNITEENIIHKSLNIYEDIKKGYNFVVLCNLIGED